MGKRIPKYNSISKKGTRAFMIGYFLLILNQVLSQSQFNEKVWGENILKAIRWGLIIYFFFLTIYKNKYPKRKKGAAWLLFVSVSTFEMLFYDGKLLLLILCLIVISSYRSDMLRVIKTHISALLIGVIFVSVCSLVGILDIQGNAKDFDNVTGFLLRPNNIRYNLGFTHFNIIPIAVLYIYLYIVILKRERFKKSWDLIALIVNYGVYLLCGSRSCIMLLFLAVFLRNLIRYFPRIFLKIGIPLSIVLLIGILCFSIILPASELFYHPITQMINILMTARLSLIRRIMELYPLNLWGYGEITFDNTSGEYLALDNGYITLFVTRGIIIGVLFLIIIIYMIINAKKNENAYQLFFILIMLIGNIIDNSLLHYASFPLFIMAFNGFIGGLCGSHSKSTDLPYKEQRSDQYRSKLLKRRENEPVGS